MKNMLPKLCLAASLTLGAQAALAQSWTAYTSNPSANALSNKNFVEMAKEISAATGGKINIAVNLSGSLGIKETDMTQALGQGVLQFSDDGFFIGSVFEGSILRLPMLFTSLESLSKGMDAVRPYVEKALAERNIVFLAEYIYPPQVFWATFDMKSIDDLKGRKMRVTSLEQSAFITAFGGSPVNMGGSEVSTALQTGVVDGALTASTGGGMIWKDQLKTNYRLGVNFFNNAYLVNKDAFDALSPEHQKILRDIAVKWAKRNTEELAAAEATVTAQLAAGGIVVRQPTADDITKASARMKSYWIEWGKNKNARTKEALEKTMSALGL